MQLTRKEHQEMLEEAAKLRAEVAKLQSELEAAAKKLRETESSRDNYSTLRSKAERELEEAHAMIDVFPDAPGRQSKEEESYRRTTYTLAARVAGWMAVRSGK